MNPAIMPDVSCHQPDTPLLSCPIPAARPLPSASSRATGTGGGISTASRRDRSPTSSPAEASSRSTGIHCAGSPPSRLPAFMAVAAPRPACASTRSDSNRGDAVLLAAGLDSRSAASVSRRADRAASTSAGSSGRAFSNPARRDARSSCFVFMTRISACARASMSFVVSICATNASISA